MIFMQIDANFPNKSHALTTNAKKYLYRKSNAMMITKLPVRDNSVDTCVMVAVFVCAIAAKTNSRGWSLVAKERGVEIGLGRGEI